MYYVCIENNLIVSILDYEPNVSKTVTVVTISDEDYKEIKNQTKFFDILSKTVVSPPLSVIEQKEQQQKNAIEREFLNSTDWKILRHMRQKYLELPTSLTEDEFRKLEMQRHAASLKIIE